MSVFSLPWNIFPSVTRCGKSGRCPVNNQDLGIGGLPAQPPRPWGANRLQSLKQFPSFSKETELLNTENPKYVQIMTRTGVT